MKAYIEEALSLCLTALNNKGSGDEQRVMQIVQQVAQQPYQGRGLGIGTLGYRFSRVSWQGRTEQMLNGYEIDSTLSWLEVLLYLADSGNYTDPEMLELLTPMTDDIIFNHVMKHIVSNLVVEEKITEAEKYIPYFRKTDIIKEENNQDY